MNNTINRILLLFAFIIIASSSLQSQVYNYHRYHSTPTIVEPCIDTVTLGQLRTLRNANNLNVNCKYVVVNVNVGGCLGSVNMNFTATNKNQVAKEIYVFTSFDNEAWIAHYNLDSNTGWERMWGIRENYAEGYNAIQRFPWGSTRVQRTKIYDNATFTCDCMPNYNHYDNEHSQDSRVDTRGISGYIYQSKFEGSANLNLLNTTTVAIDESQYTANFSGDLDGRINYTSLRSNHNASTHDYNSGSRLLFDRFNTNNIANVRNDGADIQLRYGSLDNAYIRASSGIIQSYYSNYKSYHYTYKTNEGLTYDYMTDFSGRSYRRNQNGTKTERNYYSDIGSYSQINLNDSDYYGIGNEYSSRCDIRGTNNEGFRNYYNNVNSGGIVNCTNNTGISYFQYNMVSNRSQLISQNSISSRINYNNSESNSILRLENGTTDYIQYCSASDASRQYYSNGNNYANNTTGRAYLYAQNANFVAQSTLVGRITKTLVVGNYTSKIAILSTTDTF